MPQLWTKKNDEQYKAIRDSMHDRGKDMKTAEEIAARTVNKRRRLEGETQNRVTQGTGNPNTSLESRTKAEIYNLAKQYDIEGRSGMTKAELISALRRRQGH